MTKRKLVTANPVTAARADAEICRQNYRSYFYHKE